MVGIVLPATLPGTLVGIVLSSTLPGTLVGIVLSSLCTLPYHGGYTPLLPYTPLYIPGYTTVHIRLT